VSCDRAGRRRRRPRPPLSVTGAIETVARASGAELRDCGRAADALNPDVLDPEDVGRDVVGGDEHLRREEVKRKLVTTGTIRSIARVEAEERLPVGGDRPRELVPPRSRSPTDSSSTCCDRSKTCRRSQRSRLALTLGRRPPTSTRRGAWRLRLTRPAPRRVRGLKEYPRDEPESFFTRFSNRVVFRPACIDGSGAFTRLRTRPSADEGALSDRPPAMAPGLYPR
jgi:hypothetical protein